MKRSIVTLMGIALLAGCGAPIRETQQSVASTAEGYSKWPKAVHVIAFNEIDPGVISVTAFRDVTTGCQYLMTKYYGNNVSVVPRMREKDGVQSQLCFKIPGDEK